MLKSGRLSVVLYLGIIASSFAVIQSTHKSRMIFIQWQDLLEEAKKYEVEWGQLVIEKSTLASFAGLESSAKEDLKMALPTRKQIVVIKEGNQ